MNTYDDTGAELFTEESKTHKALGKVLEEWITPAIEDKMNDVTDEDSPDEFNRLSDEETNQLND